VQRDKRKLGTMCYALIAEHMFTPNPDRYTGDDAIIDTFTREDSARATRSNSSADKLLLDRKKAEWKRHLATVRSTLSELFVWFIREVSTAEIQQDFEQVFRSHILQNQTAGNGLANPFDGISSSPTSNPITSPTIRIPSRQWNGNSKRWFVGDLK
jgi:hypothetical protein